MYCKTNRAAREPPQELNPWNWNSCCYCCSCYRCHHGMFFMLSPSNPTNEKALHKVHLELFQHFDCQEICLFFHIVVDAITTTKLSKFGFLHFVELCKYGRWSSNGFLGPLAAIPMFVWLVTKTWNQLVEAVIFPLTIPVLYQPRAGCALKPHHQTSAEETMQCNYIGHLEQ